MQLRLRDVARLPHRSNHIALRDALAARHADEIGVRIGGDIGVAVLDENEIAVALQLIARIGDDAIGGGVMGVPVAAAILMPSLRSPLA